MTSAVDYLIDVATKAKFTRLVLLLHEVRKELIASDTPSPKSNRTKAQAAESPSARASEPD